jgi:hypothetical protein
MKGSQKCTQELPAHTSRTSSVSSPLWDQETVFFFFALKSLLPPFGCPRGDGCDQDSYVRTRVDVVVVMCCVDFFCFLIILASEAVKAYIGQKEIQIPSS